MPLELIPAKEVETKIARPRDKIKIEKPKEKPTQQPQQPPPMMRAKPIPLIEPEEVIPEKISREPRGARPIIPIGDTCCVGVCTHLNDEIDGLSQAIKIRQDELKIMAMVSARSKTRRQIVALTNEISSLKDLRIILADKDVCKCIELPKKR